MVPFNSHCEFHICRSRLSKEGLGIFSALRSILHRVTIPKIPKTNPQLFAASSPRVEGAGSTCAHWLLNVQQECSLTGCLNQPFPHTLSLQYCPQTNLKQYCVYLPLQLFTDMETERQADGILECYMSWAPFPDNDGSKLVRSFLRWIFWCIVKFFRAFPETPRNMNTCTALTTS